MNRSLVRNFLTVTFSIMAVFWGGCAVISQCFDLTVNHPLLRIMHMVGGFSPTVASFVSLKTDKQVSGFKEWLKRAFDIKHSAVTYALVILFTLVYYVSGCAINGFEIGAPIFMAVILVPMMLVGGGNEELGWRMILQPELEKKLGFHAATFSTAVLWRIWHLPMFFLKGTANSEMNFFLFGIMCLTLSYAMAAIRRFSNGVFPCILFHCLINGLSAVFVFEFGILSCVSALAVTAAVSTLISIRKNPAA